ncbi:hypothetical protein DFAR_3690058 [Desulfarculales bacterium]
MQRKKQSLSIANIIVSAQAEGYIFQVPGIIDASDSSSGEECTLTTGDLIMF